MVQSLLHTFSSPLLSICFFLLYSISTLKFQNERTMGLNDSCCFSKIDLDKYLKP